MYEGKTKKVQDLHMFGSRYLHPSLHRTREVFQPAPAEPAVVVAGPLSASLARQAIPNEHSTISDRAKQESERRGNKERHRKVQAPMIW